MIKINLALKKGPVAAVDQKPGGLSMLKGLDLGSLSELNQLPLRKIALVAAVAVLSSYLLDDYKEKQLQEMDGEIAKVSVQQAKLRGDLAKTKGYEEIKKSLDGDEVMIRTKIETIQKLVADRALLPKVLLTLSSGIPPEVWLSDFKVSSDDVSLKGMSLGYNQISDFMKNLNESAYFTDLHLVNTAQAHDETGMEVANFELDAKRRQ